MSYIHAYIFAHTIQVYSKCFVLRICHWIGRALWARAMVPNQGISSMEPPPAILAAASEDGKGV